MTQAVQEAIGAETLGPLVDNLLVLDADGTHRPDDLQALTPPSHASTVEHHGTSGRYQFRLTGTASTTHPMAPEGDGKVFWFGTGPVPDPATPGGTTPGFTDLTGEFIDLDEDLNSGTRESHLGCVCPRKFPLLPRSQSNTSTTKLARKKSSSVARSRSAVLVDGVKSDTYPTDAEPPRFS